MKRLRLSCLLVIFSCTLVLAQVSPLPFKQSLVKNPVPSGLSQSDPAIQGKIVEDYGKLPLSFEANRGQTDQRVKFLSRGSGYTLFLTGDEAVFALRGKSKDEASAVSPQFAPSPEVPVTNAVLRMKLRNANRATKVTGRDELPGKSNYFIGNDPEKWRINVPTYGKVKYEGIYSGVDLIYYGNQRQLEYDFVIAPGADPDRIQFDVRGAKRISREQNGDLVLRMVDGDVRWHKPVVYQEKDGRRQEIDAHYVIKHAGRVGFEVGSHDSKTSLTD